MLKQKINNYKILSQLGEGGMAKVYLAHDNKFDANVAVKILNKEFAHNENIRKRFLAEAKNMFRMSHPNIIKVTDLIEEGDTVAFVMEYIEGETLKDYLERKGKLSDEEIKLIFSQMLEAVGYVHSQNLVHRDIKPSNFILDKKGKVKLLDFGIAKQTDVSSAEYTQTGTGMQMGTPMYMSPEQITETKSVTAQSDIYSLGVLLWQMVMGQKPYDTKTLSTFQLQTKIVQEPLVLTNTSLDSTIKIATEKESSLRYSSCESFLSEIIGNNVINDDRTIIHSDTTLIAKNNSFLENEKFPYVKIGNQIWMLENLNVDRFRSGDLIPEVKTSEEWSKAGENKQPAWCHYHNNSVIGKIYGKLYNFYAVNDSRGLAPEGWHIPTDKEWTKLTDFLGGEEIAGTKIKSTGGWKDNGNGTNSSGFAGLPGRYRYKNGQFNGIDYNGNWWSSTETNTDNAWYRRLYYDFGNVYRSDDSKRAGFSVRCLRN